MHTIKSILVPVDFSDLAASTYRYALQLAEDLSASVHLLYCLSPAPGVTTHPDVFQNITEELLQSARVTLQGFREKGIVTVGLKSRPIVTYSVSISNMREGINRQSKMRKADLVLIGTHGVKDGWDRLFGTNAASLVGKIETPLLILPAATEYHPFKSICFATDYRDSDLKSATRLNQVLYPFLPHMHFLHVQEPLADLPAEGNDFFRRAFERPQQGMEATFTSVTKHDVTDGIFEYLAKNSHDLLVMIKPNRGWWKRMMAHSETEETAGITNIPLLIMGEDAWRD